ncbi:hypothetical protein EDD11_000114 [Mortierella claussenii]|nr:hypothetical protein EDD11_000114 [Mortierella claussenii]
MYDYQSVSLGPDSDDTSKADHWPKSPSQAEAQRQHELPLSSSTPFPSCSTYHFIRRPWVILSLPVAIAVLISTSVYCMSMTPIQLSTYVQSVVYDHREEHQQQQQAKAAAGLIWQHGIVSSSSWPSLPFRVASPTFQEQQDREKEGQTNNLGEIEMAIVVVEADTFPSSASFGAMIQDELEDANSRRKQTGNDSDNDEQNEQDEDDEGIKDDNVTEAQEGAADDIDDSSGDKVQDLQEMIDMIQNEIKDAVSEAAQGIGTILKETNFKRHDADVGSPVGAGILSLAQQSTPEVGITSTQQEGGLQENEDVGDDEDQDDYFPTAMEDNGDGVNDMDDDVVLDDDKQDDDEKGGPSEAKPSKGKGKKGKTKANTNLGSTGGNGPILLCSSKSCLPSLRDAILSKLSVHIHHVMNHLRNRNTLFYMMTATAPQTKNALLAAQEDLVQRLEEQIIKDLRDWVQGVSRRKSMKGGKDNSGLRKALSSTPSSSTIISSSITNLGHAQVQVANISVASEGTFLAGDAFESEDEGDTTGFHLASLSYEDPDDDDEDHENDHFVNTSSSSSFSTKNKSAVYKRDDSNNNNQPNAPSSATGSSHEVFLSADKVLMRQEWSRWIAHWTHHSKLLILSHTLATDTLNSMNQIAISGENVPLADQRHWSWNLDKALATIMVASEMICGGPPSVPAATDATDPEAITNFLSTFSTPLGTTGHHDPNMAKAVALTLSAKKCIEALGDELEAILKRTATTA